MRPVVVKLGGSVITDKSRKFKVRRKVLDRIAKEIAGCDEKIVLVHGGGSFGHPLAQEYRLVEGYSERKQLIGLALTHLAMVKLNEIVVETLISHGIQAVSVQPSSCMITNGGKIVKAEVDSIKQMLSLDLVPVLYGDVVFDRKTGFTILSGDRIVSFLAVRLGAKKVVVGVDVDGVFTANPKMNGEAKLLKKVTPTDLKYMRFGGSYGDVTGGMAGKLRELFIPARKGIHVEIVNANKPGILARAIRGENNLGTVVSVE